MQGGLFIMENKKYLPIKIAHAVLMLAALVMLVIALVKSDFNNSIFGPSVFPVLCSITNILALIAGFIYLFKGYKKNANVYYKLFMGLCVLYEVLRTVYSAQFKMPYLDIFVYTIATIMIVILAVGKDLGKRNTYLVYGIVLICRIVPLFTVLNSFRFLGSSGFGILSQAITNLLLAGTIGFMITGKYLDKAERGTK